MLVPETEQPPHAGRVELPAHGKRNHLLARIARGHQDGLHLALMSAANAITFIPCLQLLNAIRAAFTIGPHMAWFPKAATVFRLVFAPVAWLIGVPWLTSEDWQNLLGTHGDQ